jgi:hypothetical protein
MNSSKKMIFAAAFIAVCLLTSLDVLGAEFSIGSGSDDWWITYPNNSSESGKEVSHPQWVLAALEDKPVMIYIHKTCGWCGPQTEAIAEVVDEYGSELTYFNLSAEGDDVRANEAGIKYDPDGGPISYVPLTIILTLAPGSDGKDRIIWHSTDQVTGKDWIKSYIADAISIHNEAIAK